LSKGDEAMAYEASAIKRANEFASALRCVPHRKSFTVVASLPFAPEIVLPSIQFFINHLRLKEAHPYGFKATFNPTFSVSGKEFGWVSPWHYGLNQGPIVTMIENYRTEMIWELMQSCTFIRAGLKRAGFTGGWL